MNGNILVKHRVIIWMAVLVLCSCKQRPEKPLFTPLPSSVSGIHFSNQLNDVDSARSFINEFGYMGGGVGIGDFNNDGLKDIFFSGNQVSCRLYINKGNNQFEDITVKAGLQTDVWATGVSIADVNGDGYDDIYVCVLGKDLLHSSKNLLFINQHNLTFTEEAKNYGLDFSGYCTQAVFLDYDRDGDLDMYLVNYLLGTHTNTISPHDRSGRFPGNDRLFRNDMKTAATGHPLFTDVTLDAGIKEDGYGLGVVVSDINNDGWPDIYVANDFLSNDALWLNNHNGTFTNCIAVAMQHQSYSSMGADAADINNDGLPDVMTLDMLPEDNRRRKTSFSFMNYERYQMERAMGYEPEFMRNMLQLNNGCIQKGDTSMPFFSEIGQLAGVEATDWSWSVLLADFNNDGWKDIHITNGIGRDFINADFLEYSNKIFSNNQSRAEQEKAIRERLASLHHVNLPNYLYLNNRDYTFTDASDSAGINEPSMSNGAAYADLDNDGDLDLVVNNINAEAFVFLNNTIQPQQPRTHHFLSIHLEGDSLNTGALGAKVFLYGNGTTQFQEENPVRGYFSSVDRQLLFGLGQAKYVDSLVVLWPDARVQVWKHLPADSFITVSWKNAQVRLSPDTLHETRLFTETGRSEGLDFFHHENEFNDFAVQRLLPHKYSQLGPFIATGDIDNDGAMDFFVGNAFNFSGAVFTQQKDGSFRQKKLVDSIKMEEDMGCLLFDADKDGDLDLLVAGGDVQYEDSSVFYQPRLYLNDGKGNFSLSKSAIPASVKTIAGPVCAGDLDGDGYPELFIGGRISKAYPSAPRSFVLKNNRGVFSDITGEVCAALQNPGMISGAVWTDFNHDGQADLVIAGEWMPLRFFENQHGRLAEVTAATGLTQMNGLWRSLIAADVDNDGDMDLVAGNLGQNCNYHVSAEQQMELFASDIDNNGIVDPIMFYYLKDDHGRMQSYPAIGRNLFAEQVPAIKKKFIRHADFARAGFEDIFPGKGKNDLTRLYCDEDRSCWFENTGKGKFIKHPLPVEAQFAPVNAIACDDFDNDGYKDLLLAGNEYQADVMTGRYDASYGCFLKGSDKKTFTPVKPAKSGFIVRGDVKDLAVVRLKNRQTMVLAAVNNDSLRAFGVSAGRK